MSLATKIFAAFCLVFLAGLAQAFLALPGVESAFVSNYLARPDTPTEPALPEGLGFIPLMSGALGLMLIPVALALRARRVIVSPLRSMSATLDRIGRDGFDLPPPLQRADEIGNLDRAVRHVASRLTAPEDPEGGLKLAAETDRFRDFAGLAADWLWQTDADGRITYVSGKLPGMQDQEPDRFIGCPLNSFMSVPVEGGATRALELESRRPLRDLICRYDGTDGIRYCRLSGRAFVDVDGSPAGYRGTATDTTAEVQARESEKKLAFKDPLTGLANRRLVEDRIEQALDARALTRGDVAVICLDLDRFKTLNDSLGHDLGDAVLRQVGTRLTAVAGPQDTVGRLADDAFAIVQAAGAQPEAAERLCLTILNELRTPFVLGEGTIRLTASIGCSIASPEEASALNLLRNADTAMYRAIQGGRDTYRVHETEMTTSRRNLAAMDRDLRAAIENGDLDMRFQPFISSATGDICGFETLVRWPRPGHGMIPSRKLLSLAEETGLILPLGELTLTTACRTAAKWPNICVAVNLSPGLLLHEGLLKAVQRALQVSGLPPHRLELEITEAALSGAEDSGMFQIDSLREIGVRVVLDKFGSGSTSLQTLRRVRFDKLKLDRNITSGIVRDKGAAALMRSVFDLSHALGMETAAEGVAHEEQAVQLVEHGCGQLQGKHFGRAGTAEQVSALLNLHNIPKSEAGL